MWIKKTPPQIPGYETLGDDVQAKRFLQFGIQQLLDTSNPIWTSDPIWEADSLLKTRAQICAFVISEIDYPMRLGMPTDKHVINCFDGKCCHHITQDYWSKASETLMTYILNQRVNKKGYGDCEDVSILLTTLFQKKGWPAYECLGLVLKDGEILGGHGWAIFKDENDIWRLYEATLDIPPAYPDGYPVIDPEETSWEVNGLTYQGLVKFNSVEYYENVEADMMSCSLSLNTAQKETRKKYKAISEAWHQKAKPLKKIGFLSRIRWR